MKKLATVAAGIGAALVMSVTPVSAIEAPHNWKPCRTEDSVHCTFEAKLRGNHEGRSFYHRGNQVAHYVSHKRAARRVLNGFRYYGWTYLGKQGHHGCYGDDDSSAVICRDGFRP